MSVRRVVAASAVFLAFAGTGAFAIAQTQSTDSDDARVAALGLDTSREYPESFLNTAEHYEKLAPPESSPGPVIQPDEVHIPEGEVPETFVKGCVESASKDESLDSNSICRAILLKNAGAIEAGVYKVDEVGQRYEAFIKEEK